MVPHWKMNLPWGSKATSKGYVEHSDALPCLRDTQPPVKLAVGWIRRYGLQSNTASTEMELELNTV